MRDPVFEAQFRTMKDSFASRGVQIEVAYQPNGEVDYLYEVDRLLARNDTVERLRRLLPGLRRAEPTDREDHEDRDDREHHEDEEDQDGDRPVVLAIDRLEGGRLPVPEALHRLADSREFDDGPPPFSPHHIFHITRTCPAVEPERPCGDDTAPWPPICSHEAKECPREEAVRIGVSDTGLLDDIGAFGWLVGVRGEPDSLAVGAPGGPPRIPEYTGHGTFIAGVARSMAPESKIFVNNHFSSSGGELESVMIGKLFELARTFDPEIINLSAGTNTWQNWGPLGLDAFHATYPAVTLVAAAGNDSSDRPFYPAALDWVVGVGALAADQAHRAWFSNYGDWVDVYAVGEGMVNAYAVGEYTYQEPPKRPSKQNFDGMARWDGTSFSAPLVAGLIADRMRRTGATSKEAADALLAAAQAAPLQGVGPSLYPCQHD